MNINNNKVLFYYFIFFYVYRLGPGTQWYSEEAHSLLLKSAIWQGQGVKHQPAFLNHSCLQFTVTWPSHCFCSITLLELGLKFCPECWSSAGYLETWAVEPFEAVRFPLRFPLRKERLWQTQEFLLFDHQTWWISAKVTLLLLLLSWQN